MSRKIKDASMPRRRHPMSHHLMVIVRPYHHRLVCSSLISFSEAGLILQAGDEGRLVGGAEVRIETGSGADVIRRTHSLTPNRAPSVYQFRPPNPLAAYMEHLLHPRWRPSTAPIAYLAGQTLGDVQFSPCLAVGWAGRYLGADPRIKKQARAKRPLV